MEPPISSLFPLCAVPCAPADVPADAAPAAGMKMGPAVAACRAKDEAMLPGLGVILGCSLGFAIGYIYIYMCVCVDVVIYIYILTVCR